MSTQDIMKKVSQALASAKLNEAQLLSIAGAVERSKFPVIGLDICTHGICIDIGVDGGLGDFDLSDVIGVATGPIRRLEIFPEGIILDERTRIRLTQSL